MSDDDEPTLDIDLLRQRAHEDPIEFLRMGSLAAEVMIKNVIRGYEMGVPLHVMIPTLFEELTSKSDGLTAFLLVSCLMSMGHEVYERVSKN